MGIIAIATALAIILIGVSVAVCLPDVMQTTSETLSSGSSHMLEWIGAGVAAAIVLISILFIFQNRGKGE